MLAAIPFLPALGADFVALDDPAAVKALELHPGLGGESLRWMFTTTHMGHYQPLTWVSYAIDAMVSGSGPRGFHRTNLLLHGINAALVYLVARRLLRAALPSLAELPLELGAAAAALVFGVHPLRVESVAWVTERRDVLSVCFLLLATLAYLRAFAPTEVPIRSRGWYAASIVLLAISLLCKAWGMTFFVVALILDWYPLRRLPESPVGWVRTASRPVLLQKAPYVVLGIAAMVMAGYAQASMPFTRVGFDAWGVGARILQAAYGLMFYLQKLVWPTNLAALYELPASASLMDPRFAAGLVFALALGSAAVVFRRRMPALTAAAAIYAVVLGPALGFNQSGPQLVADRYSYVANIPWTVVIGGVLASWVAARRARVASAIAVCAAIFACLGVLTWKQTRVWHDTDALFGHSTAAYDGPLIRLMYARELLSRGKKEAALAQLERSTELEPKFGQAWLLRGEVERDVGRFADAERSLTNARPFIPEPWQADMMLGLMYIQNLDRPREAAERFRAAIAGVERPGATFSARPYLMLAAALDIMGDEQGARQWLQKAMQYPETREEAARVLRDMDAEAGTK